MCRLCPGRAERGAKGRREVACVGLWGLFGGILLFFGDRSPRSLVLS